MQSVEYAILEFVAIIASMLVAGHYKGISIWKRLLLAGLAILSGAIGTKLMSFIEYQQISGGIGVVSCIGCVCGFGFISGFGCIFGFSGIG